MARICRDSATLANCLSFKAKSLSSSGYITADATPYLREALNLYEGLGNDPVATANCMSLLAAAMSHTDTDAAQSLIVEVLRYIVSIWNPITRKLPQTYLFWAKSSWKRVRRVKPSRCSWK